MFVERHCGNICIDVAPPSQLTECNCSLCRRYATLWGYYRPEEVTVAVGSAGEQTYLRADGELAFVRCGNCGCVTHYRVRDGLPDPKVAINFRLAETAFIQNIPRRLFDGANQ